MTRGLLAGALLFALSLPAPAFAGKAKPAASKKTAKKKKATKKKATKKRKKKATKKKATKKRKKKASKKKRRAKKKKRAKKKRKKIPRHRLSLVHVNTKEKLTRLWTIRADKKNKDRQWVGKRARKKITHFLRDWRTGKKHRVPERLIWYLYLVGQHFDAPVHVVSGYRHKERKTSRHKQGKAIDIRIPGVTPRALWNYCKRFDNVGLGYYPNSKFVHMDVRKRSYYWIDDSGPGEASDYRKGVGQRKQRKKKRRKTAKKKRKRSKKAKKRIAKRSKKKKKK